jgi:uncharacterized peroxidase-related enzyme
VLSEELVQAVLTDWRTAPVDERLRATLGFLEKLTLRPGEVGPSDVAPLRAAGLSDRAVEDAIQVCALFNVLDRMADSLDFAIPSAEGFKRGASALLRFGYRLM